MNSKYNYNNTAATGHYSNSRPVANATSALSNSISHVQKPLFLVAAAMLMLIFFTATAHATSLNAPTLNLNPTTIDAFQSTSEATIIWTGGTAPYTAYLTYGPSPSTCSSDTTPYDISSYNSNPNNNNYAVGTISLPVGVYYFCTSVTDSSNTPVTLSSSTPVELSVQSGVSVSTPTISPSSIDAGQSVTVNTIVTGGVPTYSSTPLLYESTSPSGTFTTVGSCAVTGTYYASVSCTATMPIAGTYYFKIYDSDTAGGSNTSSSSNGLTVTSDPVFSTPSATPSATDIGKTITVTSTASGGTLPYDSAFLYYSTSPTGIFTSGSIGSCSINNGAITCTTTANSLADTYYFQIQVYDNLAEGARSPTSNLVTVAAPPIVSITTPSAATTIDVSHPITISGSGSGGTGSYAYSWSVANDDSCYGFTVPGSVASFIYTPSAPSANCAFTLTVTDSVGGTGTATTSIITVTQLKSVTITANNPIVDIGQSETYTVTTNGGTTPYTYTLSGCTSGTHTSYHDTSVFDPLNVSGCTIGSDIITLSVEDNFSNSVSNTVSINVYAMPTATTPSPSNTLLDSGQSVTYTTTVSGGKGPFTVGLYASGSLTPIETNTLSSDGTVTFAAFIPPIGTDTYHVSATDTGTTTHFVFNSTSNTINVNKTVQKPAIYSFQRKDGTSPLDIGQYATIYCSNCDVSGLDGQPSYSYQWLVGFDANTPTISEGNLLCGSTSITSQCTFNTANIPTLQPGTYNAVLQVTDSATTPVTNSSSKLSLTVNPVLKAPTISPGSFIYNQGAVISESATPNGGTLSGTDSYVFIWYLNGNPINCANIYVTCRSSSAELQNDSITIKANTTMVQTSPDILSVNVIDDSLGQPIYHALTYHSRLTSAYFLCYDWFSCDNMFINLTKTNKVYGNENSSSIQIVVHSAVNASRIIPHDQNPLLIDNGQHILLKETPTGGSGIYNFEWYLNGYPNYLGTSIISSNFTGEISNTITFNGNDSTQLTNANDIINACAIDHYIPQEGCAYSLNSSIHVFPALGTPTITNTTKPSATSLTMDVGQHVLLNGSETGGTGNYLYTWYDNGVAISSCNSPSKPNCKFVPTAPQASPTGKTNDITVTATDIGTDANATPVQQQTSLNFPVTVYSALNTPTVAPSPVKIDQKQSIVLTATDTGGTGPLNYIYTWYDGLNTITGCVSVQVDTCTFATTLSTATGAHDITVSVLDSGTTTPPAEPPMNMTSAIDTITVFVPPEVLVSATNTIMDIGQISTISSAPTGGTGSYAYSWTNTGTCPGFTSLLSGSFIYTPTGATSDCVFDVIVTDVGTTSGATPPATASASTNTLTVYAAPTANDLTPSNILLDNGQYVTYNVLLSGGSGNFLVELKYEPTNNDAAYLNNQPDGTSKFASFQPPYGTPLVNDNTYYASAVDLGTTTPFYFLSTFNTIIVNNTLGVITPASESIHADQPVTITGVVTPGQPDYSYQWFASTPCVPSYTQISGATSSSYPFNAIAYGCNLGGTYDFKLQVTDSATTPETVNSLPTVVTVNAMFANKQLFANTYFTANDYEDAGFGLNASYWAIDNLTQTVEIWRTGLTNYSVHNSYSGIWCTFANARSPQDGVVEPNDGCGTLTSSYNALFITFSAFNSLAQTIGNLGTFNYGGTKTDILNVPVPPNQQVGNPTPFDWLRYYFPGYGTGQEANGSDFVISKTDPWTNSYNYATYPLQGQNWVYTVTEIPSGPGYTSTYPNFTIPSYNGDIVTYQVPTVTMTAPSNSIVDSGQYEVYSATVYNGIGPFTIGLYKNGSPHPIETNTLPGDGTVTFAAFQPSPIGSDTYYVSATDNGITPGAAGKADYTFNSLSNTVTVNAAFSVSASASNSTIHADQISELSNTTTGGTKAYAYQWFIETPQSAPTYSMISGATSNDYTFNVIKLGYTQGGTYSFILQAIDSATTPETVNSVAVPVTVNAMFSKPQQLLDVNANVINDEDSGYNGYWGLDSFTRHITANQIGLQTFVINFTDNGQTFVPAGGHSPNAGTTEPYNGITTLNGAQNYTFNATSFVTNNLPVATNGMFIGTLNEHGSVADIVNNIPPIGVSSEMYYIDGYFSNPINATNTPSPNWGGFVYKYVYSVYPPQGQTWIDAGNVLQANSGDIVTYQVPTVTLSAPSNSVLDAGQYETYSATVYNGIGPFTVGLYQTGNLVPIETNSLPVDGTVTFHTFTPLLGTDTYYVSAEDTGTTTGAVGPADYTFISSSNTVQVNTVPTLSLAVNSIFDSGQTATFTMGVSGGTGPFTVELYNITGSKQVGSNVIVNVPGGFNTISFTVNSPVDGNIFTYGSSATDLGTTTPYPFSSGSNTITVNTNMTKPKTTVAGHFYDQGQTVEISTSQVSGGTPPYVYTFTITNSSTNQNFYTCSKVIVDVCSFSAGQTGMYYANVIVTDSASTPANSVSVNPANFIVSPALGPAYFSTAGVSANTPEISYGNSILLTATITGPTGTSPYRYTFKVYNAENSQLAYTSTPTVSSSTTNTLEYTPANNGIYYATVYITDNATPNEPASSSASTPFLVGSAATPTIVLTPASTTLDSGQTEVFTMSVFGGIGPFNVELYNITGSKPQGSNVTIASTPGVNTISLTVGTPISTIFSYNAIATDTTTHITFNSVPESVTVNPPFSDGITLNATKLDLGQKLLITEQISGGTPPYTYNYNIYQGSNTPIVTDSANSVNTTESYAYVTSLAGSFTTNVVVYDSSNIPKITNSSTKSFTVYNAPTISISPSNSVPTSGDSETYTATVSNGIGPFTVELYNITGSSQIGSNIIVQSPGGSNTITFTVNSPATGNTISFNAIATDLGTTNPYTFNSATNTLTVTPTSPPPSPTTTIGGGGGSPGGGGGGGSPGGGGGSSKPMVVPYNTTTVHGWKVLNFTQDDSESFSINGHTFDITLNSISPTLVDVTVNGFAYTLNMNQPMQLTGLSNYSVDLASISYLPIQHSAVVEMYGPNMAKTNGTTTTGGNTIVNNTTTVKTTATTTVATTTVVPKVSTVKPTTTVSAPPASTTEIGAGIIVVILLIIGGMYYYMKSGKKKGRR